MSRGKRPQADSERTEELGQSGLSRRRVLGGIAALPVLYGIASAAPALAATATKPNDATASGTAAKGSSTTPAEGLVRGVERRYNAPLLTPGTRLVLPPGIKAVAIEDYYRGPHLAAVASAWPSVIAADGSTVDAAIVPDRGAPTRIAMLSGFTEGWYELAHANGRADRVTWDAHKLPFLWFYGEFGATKQAPFRDVFYTLALQPFSRNPYSRKSLAA
ncbi:MAG TPA: hypothetical protein VK816_01255 [Jatrophihabitantaceae bacterium]|nr:hypothetical protein [Jatrophihabitantaceae bacterium]